MTPVTKSAPFEWDFEREALYLCETNPSAAQRFVDAVDAAVKLLAQHPEIGPVWRYGNPKHPTRYLLTTENLARAWERVRSNHGAPGIDGLTIEVFDAEFANVLRAIQSDLLAGTCKPQPVRALAART